MGRPTVLNLPPQLVFSGGGSNVALSWFRQGRRKLASKLLTKNVGGRHHQKLTVCNLFLSICSSVYFILYPFHSD
jgi:hypothetical protein